MQSKTKSLPFLTTATALLVPLCVATNPVAAFPAKLMGVQSAIVFHQQGKVEEAIKNYKKSLTIDPNDESTQNFLKEAQQQLKSPENRQSVAGI